MGLVGPDPRLVGALDQADAVQSYSWCTENGKVDDKRNWSNPFADACAYLAAPIVRQGLGSLGAPPDLVVLPTTGGQQSHPSFSVRAAGNASTSPLYIG